jgi:hypothetical protein
MPDEQQPVGGGVFVRLGRIARRWGVAVPVIEELYGPSRHEARTQVEERQQAARPAPAPTDPPDAEH